MEGPEAANVLATIIKTTAVARNPRIGSSWITGMPIIEGRLDATGKTW
jgi:hypothetical protein